MVIPKWFFLGFLQLALVLGSSSAYANRERAFGDVSDDEVAIDHLEDYLEHAGMQPGSHPRFGPQNYQEINLPHLYNSLKIGDKIEFAVPPSDPRYYVPSSVLQKAQLGPSGQGGPSDPSLRQEGPSPHASHVGGALEPHPLQEAALLQDIYSKYGPDGEYKGHSFGPLPVPQGGEDSDTTATDSVNFLHESRYQAEVPHYFVRPSDNSAVLSDFYFVALVSGCTAAAVCAVLGAGICYFRLHKSKRDAADAEYPAYGVTGPCKDFSPAAADRKLAQSAHMFHYQHQKQQMIAIEKSSGDERHCSTSDVDSEEEGEEGDYTVYECPGLAPTDEMEVKNPLFSDDPTPATPAAASAALRNPKGTNDIRKDPENEEDEEEEEEERRK